MSSDWQELTLADIAEPKGGLVDGPFGSNLPASCYVENGVPVIRGSNLTVGLERFNSNDFVYVSNETLIRIKRSECLPNDIVFTKKGTLGQTGIVPSDSLYEKYLLSSNQMRLRVNTNLADPEYVYYWVSSNASIEKIKRDSEFTGVPKINLDYLKKFPIVIPELTVQKKISKILSGFDNIIELNYQINQTLEAMAQAIFKNWFVDFEPVNAKIAAIEAGEDAEGVTRAAMSAISGKTDEELDQLQAEQPEHYIQLKNTAELFPAAMQDSELGDIPEGWKVKQLDHIANYQNGLALQKFRPENEDEYLPVLKIAQLKKGFADGEEKASINIKSEFIVENGDVVFSWSGSLMVDIWCGGKVALNQHLFKVTSDKYPKWFYYYWTKHHLNEFQRIAAAKAVTMGHIKREHLSAALCATPSPQIFNNISKTIGNLLGKAIEVRLENFTLKELRDTLLPNLLSGELPVNALEVEGVDV